MAQSDLSPLKARLLKVRGVFVAESIAQALEDAAADGVALSYREHGMVEPTAYGQRIEDEAADEAEDIFNKVLDGYLQEVANFKPSAAYNTALDYAANMYNGAQSEAEEDALERILAVHEAYAREADNDQKRDHAQFLLKAPLEFADANTQDLLNQQDQQVFTTILGKLRHLAAG